YLPIFGRWLAERREGLSQPVLPEYFGYVYGKETIQVERLDVPVELENRPLTVHVTESGFDLLDHEGNRIAHGKPGEEVDFNYGSGTGVLALKTLDALPGARFTLERSSRLATIENLQSEIVIDEKNKPSGVLAMSLEGTDPVQTASILNTIGAAYVRQNVERRAAE